MTTNTFETKEQYLAFRAAWATAAQSKELTAEHHILFNILCGRPIDRGFTPITKATKLQNGFRINHGLYHAAQSLQYRMVNEEFMAPFGDTITKEMIEGLEIPEVKSLNSDFGKGKKIAKMIIEKNLKNITFADLDNLLEEAA